VKIAELESILANRQEDRVVAKVGEISITDDAGILSIGSDTFLMDEGVERTLASYLKIPPAYLSACPPDFKATTLRFWMGEHSDADAVTELINGAVVSIHSPDQLMIPVRQVVQVAERVFSSDAEVRHNYLDDERVHLDITTSEHQVDVQSPGYRQVGDITEAGLRFLAYPTQTKAPSVGAYLERLACTNGMTTTERAGQISLRGRTVDEVLEEMEQAARMMLSTRDNRLERYAATARQPIPGSRQAFAHQLAREANLPRSVLDSVMELVNQLPDNATVYDINQAFTSVANTDVNYATRMRLQALGGSMAFEAERILARCGTCQHPLEV
jgi:hypothetical protein